MCRRTTWLPWAVAFAATTFAAGCSVITAGHMPKDACVAQAESPHAGAIALATAATDAAYRDFGPTDPRTAEAASTLSKLANQLLDDGDFHGARAPFILALKAFGPEHPIAIADIERLTQLGRHYDSLGDYDKADDLYLPCVTVLGFPPADQALAQADRHSDRLEHVLQSMVGLRERGFGPVDLSVAHSYSNLGFFYLMRQQYESAERAYRHALDIRTRLSGPAGEDALESLVDLAVTLELAGRYSDAEPLYMRALAIRAEALGVADPRVRGLCQGLEDLYRKAGKRFDGTGGFLLCRSG